MLCQFNIVQDPQLKGCGSDRVLRKKGLPQCSSRKEGNEATLHDTIIWVAVSHGKKTYIKAVKPEQEKRAAVSSRALAERD